MKNLYHVTRPFCNPSFALVLAKTAKEAKELTNSTFGAVNGMVVKKLQVKESCVLPTINANKTIYPKFE